MILKQTNTHKTQGCANGHLVEVPVEGILIVDHSGDEGEHQTPASTHLSMPCTHTPTQMCSKGKREIATKGHGCNSTLDGSSEGRCPEYSEGSCPEYSELKGQLLVVLLNHNRYCI